MGVLVGACEMGKEEPASGTVAPASPPPADLTPEDDPAMTQTVEIGEERSPNEGAGLVYGEGAENPPPVQSDTAPQP